jgi:hypothetical protein
MANVSQSSHLQASDYDEASQILTVQFTDGSIYQYTGVPQDVYFQWSQSGRSGIPFWSLIRGRYPTTMLVPGSRRR